MKTQNTGKISINAKSYYGNKSIIPGKKMETEASSVSTLGPFSCTKIIRNDGKTNFLVTFYMFSYR